MKLLSRAFNFYINASIHVAFAVTALAGVTFLEYNLQMPFSVWMFIFLSTIVAYNFVKYAEVNGFLAGNIKGSLKFIRGFTLLCFLSALPFGFQLSGRTLLLLVVLALFTFLYAIPFHKRKNLRTLGGLKIFIVALVWACFTVLVPAIASEEQLDFNYLITFFQRILIVLALTIPFEIRDLEYDNSSLKTLPQKLGLKKVKSLGIAFLLISVFLEWTKNEFSVNHFISILTISILIGVILISSQKKQPKYLASFWVESVPVFWFFLLCFLE